MQLQIKHTNYVLLFISVILFTTSCDRKKRRAEIRKEAEREIVTRDSIDAHIKSTILAQEYKDSSIQYKVAGIEDLSILSATISNNANQKKLIDKKNITVFAPSNEAFKATKLLEKGVTDIEQNTNIKCCYVVEDKWSTDDIAQEINDNNGTFDIVTLNGEKLAASLENNKIVLKDSNGQEANIIKSDIDASNGTIHIVDAVLSTH